MRVPAQKTRSHSAASAVAKRSSNAAPSASAKKRKVQDCSPTRAKSPSALAKRKAPAKKTVVAKKTTAVVKKMTAKKKEAAKKRKPSAVKSAVCKKKEGKGSTTNVKKKVVPQKATASKAVVLKKQSGSKKEPAESSAVASSSADKPAEKEAHVSPEETRKKPLKKATAQPKEKVRAVKIQKPKSAAAAASSVKSKKKLPTKKQQVPKTGCKKPFVKHAVVVKGVKQKAAGRKKSGTGDSKAKCSMLSVTEKPKKSSVVGKKSPSSNKGSAVDNDVEKKSPVNIANTKEVVSESSTVKKVKNNVIKKKPKKIDGLEVEGTSDNVAKTPSREEDEEKPRTQDSNGGNIGSQTQKRKCLSKKKPNPKSKQISEENNAVVEEHNIEDEVTISLDQSQNKDILKDDSCTNKVSPKTKEFGMQHERSEIVDTQPTTTESTDESTTSDEITLDRLRQQQLRVVKVTNPVEVSSGCEDKIDKSIQVKPSSPSGASRSEELVSTCDSLQFMGGICIKQEVEDDVEVKLESDTDNSSRSASARKWLRKKHTSSGKSKDRSVDTEEDGDVEDEDDDDEKFKTTAQSSKNGAGSKDSSDTEQRARRMRLFGFWSGPKRHRVASLNALAKVHCLYENESRGALLGYCRASKVTKKVVKPSPEEDEDDESSSGTVVCTRTLRSMPGLRGAGRHWDVLALTTSSSSVSSSSSDDNENDNTGDESGSVASPAETKSSPKPPAKGAKKVVRRKRKRCELMMDLKDMVVRKRMASLNASAILAASYSTEKRPAKLQPKQEPNPSPPPAPAARKKSRKRVLSKKIIEEDDDSSSSGAKEVESRSAMDLRAAPASSNQVAVIVNKDTDVTITGVYVNSTTRSTLHEGFCSIAGMQYRISSTSHTQTEATAVATETVLHAAAPPAAPEHPAAHHAPEPPLKSYTPLGALSSMQPPGSGVPPPPPPLPPPPPHPPHHHHHHPHHHHHHAQAPLSPPLGRRHGCTSAFSAPPPPPPREHDAAYIHGYYQPAGPLISSHHHVHAVSGAGPNPGKAPTVLPTLEASATPTPPPSAASHSLPPSQVVSSNSTPSGTTRGGDESSDNDVIITATSCSSGGGEVISQQQPPPAAYRYPAAYPPPTATTPHYAYPYTQHYPSPPASASVQYSAPHHYHAQDLCFSGYPAASAPPPPYFHKAYSTPPPAAYHRRYLVPPAPQYYASELYPGAQSAAASAPTPPQQAAAASQSAPQATQQMVVAGGGSYLSAPREHAPPPSLVETYPPPPIVDPYPPPGYYTGYGAGPGSAACYTHSPPSRGLTFIDSAYPSCPCPMQSCPKNVHTGPLTGDGKGPHLLSKQQQPLPPVVLALPLEPPGALGPPSPARGSAGISQPPTPATASVRNPNVLAEEDCTPFTWSSEAQLDKQELTMQQEKQMPEDTAQITVVTSSEKDYCEVTTFPEMTAEEDVSQHGLLTIMKQPKLPACEKPISRRPSADSVNASKNVPLLMCDKFQGRNANASSVDEEVVGLVVHENTDGLKHEEQSVEADTTVTKSVNSVATEQELDVSKVETGQKRKPETEELDKNEKLLLPAPKRQKCSKNNKVANCASQDQNNLKKENLFPKIVSSAQDNATKKTAPLSSNNNTVVNVKPCPKKRKLEDIKDSCENAEPVEPVLPPTKKKKLEVKISNNPKDLKTKTYPSRAKKLKDNCGVNCNSRDCDIINAKSILDSALCRNRTLLNTSTKKSNLPTVPVENVKMPPTKVECKTKGNECKPKVNGSAVQQKKHTLRKSKQNDAATDDSSTLPTAPSKARRKNSSTCELNSVANTPLTKKPNLLQSQQRLESLSEEETEVIPKVLCVGGVRRPSLTTNKKEQSKGQVRKALKASNEILEQQKASVGVALSKKVPLKRSASITPKWSNGWSWNGEPFYAKVFLSSDDSPQLRKCYPSMRHIEGDIISPHDCVLLKSGTRKIDLPFIAKVAALWENQDDGEMMVSLLWYYRPEHTDQGRREEHMEDEVFASKHKDTNSVACIEDKCYVLTFNEYCRFRKTQRRIEECVREPALVVPQTEGYARASRQPPTCVAPDMVFFCRKVYDFRQRRILKNPG